MIKPSFNDFISANFRGLSAHTLYEYIMSTVNNNSIYKTDVSNLVYESIYHVYTNKYTALEYKMFIEIRRDILKYYSINDPYKFRDWLAELHYCLDNGYTTFKTSRLLWLKENALDMYITRVISLSEFQYILKADITQKQ